MNNDKTVLLTPEQFEHWLGVMDKDIVELYSHVKLYLNLKRCQAEFGEVLKTRNDFGTLFGTFKNIIMQHIAVTIDAILVQTNPDRATLKKLLCQWKIQEKANQLPRDYRALDVLCLTGRIDKLQKKWDGLRMA